MFVLFKSLRGTYEELGGKIDGTLTPEKNAKKEIKEESIYLFNFDAVELEREINNKKLYVDIDTPDGKIYRCYICKMILKANVDLAEWYDFNKEILQRMYNNPEIRETEALRNFLENDMEIAIQNGKTSFVNTKNESVTLSDRTLKIFNAYYSDKKLREGVQTYVFPCVIDVPYIERKNNKPIYVTKISAI